MAFGSGWGKTGGRIAATALAGVSLLAINTALYAQPANAQPVAVQPAGAVNVSVPAGSLESGLLSLGRQTNLRMLYPSNLTAGKRTAGVSGQMSPQQAVTQLLAGTGLRASFTSRNTVQVFDPTTPVAAGALPAGAIPLDTIDVQGASRTLGAAPPPYAGGQVATGARLGILGNRSIMNTPFSVTSFTDKTIADQQARSVGDVVKNDPSVRTTWNDGTYSNQFAIRGFQVVGPDIAINGLYGLAPYQITGTSWAERVEVLHGPGALLNGMSMNGSIGGTINIVPKRAPDFDITQLTLGYISRSQFGTSVDMARRYGENKEWGVRFNGSYMNGQTPVDGQKNELGSASLGLDYRGDRLRLSADLIYQKDNSDDPARQAYAMPGFQIPRPPKASADLGQDWYYVHANDYTGIVRGEYDITDNVTAYATFGAHHNDQVGVYNFLWLQDSKGNFQNRTYLLPTYNNIYTGEVGVRSKFETGPVRHELIIAANRLYNDAGGRNQTFSLVNSNLYNPVPIPQPDMSSLYDWTPQTGATTLSSLAIADNIYMFDDRLQFIVGGRYQNVQQLAWDATTRVQTADYNKSAFSPAVGVVIKPWQNVSLYGSYIEGLSQGPTAPVGAANYGATFAPIQSKQYEAGVKVDWGRVTTTASVFQIEQPSGYLDTATNIYGVNGETRNRGVELSAFGQLTDSVRLLGGVTFMDGVQTQTANGTNNGKKAIGIPDTQLNLGAEWDTPFLKGLTLTGRMIYTSKQYYSADNTQSIPDWTRFDVGARYTFKGANGKPVTIRASVENVFDKSYWTSASSSYGLTRSAPRTYLLSATMDF